MNKEYGLVVLFGLGLAFLINAILAIPAMLLWNALVPRLFGVSRVRYRDMYGLMILIGLIKGAEVSMKNGGGAQERAFSWVRTAQ